MSTDPSATGTATATDNCSGIVTVTYADQKSGTSINRTWKATDASGNTATGIQTINYSAAYTASITSVPTSNVNTGGSVTSLFLGYGAQSTALTVTGLPSAGAPYTYQWTSIALGNLNSVTAAAPVFTPTAAGNYQFSVTVTNKNGCTATASINICVKDVRVPGSNGTKVYVCHTASGKLATPQTIEVLISQVASHINGNCGSKGTDKLGSCNQGACDAVIPVATAVDPKTEDVLELISIKSDATATTEDIKVTVMPNPTTTYFTLKLESKDQKTPMSIRVLDASGRAIEAKQQIEPNSNIQIGSSYPSGTFYTEVIQGNKRKVVQMIKARG
jgi:PKD repeat protein